MWLLALFVIWALAELYVAIRVAEAIGAIYMLLLLIASWPLGVWALRSRGRAALRRLSEAVAARRPPGREVLDGALVVLGGGLLLIPGFITDVAGICLLLPPIRALARWLLVRNLQSALVVRAARFARPSPHYDVDSTATELDSRRLRS